MDDDERFGRPVVDWRVPPRPGPARLAGRHATLERLDPARHAGDLFRANAADDAMWDFLPYGPFGSVDAYRDWADARAAETDPMFYAIHHHAAGQFAGVASFLRIAPEAGSIEVGHIALSAALQRTAAATEAIYLMMGWAFDAGYRRFEWKCNALNLASRRAAQRFGFSYEGVFRQAGVNKGRNRDTAWFACIDGEWPALRTAFDTWLDPGNFDAGDRQIHSLSEFTRPILVARDPAVA